MSIADEFPAYDPEAHDPATCTRRPCRRCTDQTPTPPAVKPNPHQARTVGRSRPKLAGLTADNLRADLLALSKLLDRHGEATWQYVEDWRKTHRIDRDSNRGGGNGGASTVDQQRERREDERVAGLFDRLEARVSQLVTLASEVQALVNETVPLTVNTVKPQALAVQAAADGWCRSCFRDDQHLEPITLRPDGTPFFRDLCKWCGYWQAEHGQQPSVDVLRQRHEGRRVRRSA